MAETTQTPSMPQSLDDAKRVAQRSLDEARDLGTELMTAVRDNAVGLLDEQRDRAAGQIAAASDLLRRSAQSLDDKSGVVARTANEAAVQIDDFADWLRESSWGDMANDIEGFARRNPMLFIGAAAALGFVAYRFFAAAPGGSGGTPMRSARTSAGGTTGEQGRMVSTAVASGEFH